MKLYKFRALGTVEDFNRLKNIIETGHFWCSNFWDLNDPMEGVYKNSSILSSDINKIFSEKNKYKICSFTGQKGFNNTTLWGYYANGFKGVIIEIEIRNINKINPINYVSKEIFQQNIEDVKLILLRKLDDWKSEDEFRFLIKSENNLHKIGKIIKVHFGTPYSGLTNTNKIFEKSKNLNRYNELKEKLEKICRAKNISIQDINQII